MKIMRMTLRKLFAVLGGLGSTLLVAAVCICSCAVLQQVYHAKVSDQVRVAVVIGDAADADELLSGLNEDGGISAVEFSERDAENALLMDWVDGVLTLSDGFSLTAPDVGDQMSYRGSPQSSASAYVLTRVFDVLSTARIRQSVIDEVLRQYPNADSVVKEAWRQAEEENPGCRLLIQSNTGESDAGGRYVLSGLSTGIHGFIAMLLMFLYVSMLQWLLQEDVKRVSERMFSLTYGRCMGTATDFLALLFAGLLIGVGCCIAAGTLTGRTTANLAAYCVCLSGLMILLSKGLKRDGGIQMAVPFLTLFTSILGGCLFDFGALSKAFEKLALLTPQGWYLSGTGGGSAVPACILLAVGLAGFLFSLPAGRRQ